MNLDETLRELCRAAVPAFTDTAFVHLYAPLPVGDEAGTPGVLRLRSADRASPRDPDARDSGPSPADPHALPAAEVVTPAADGLLSKLLQDGRPVFGNTPGVTSAAAELLGTSAPAVPPGRRLIIAPLHGRSHVLGSAVLIRGPGRPEFTADDLIVASQLATHRSRAGEGDAVRA